MSQSDLDIAMREFRTLIATQAPRMEQRVSECMDGLAQLRAPSPDVGLGGPGLMNEALGGSSRPLPTGLAAELRGGCEHRWEDVLPHSGNDDNELDDESVDLQPCGRGRPLVGEGRRATELQASAAHQGRGEVGDLISDDSGGIHLMKRTELKGLE